MRPPLQSIAPTDPKRFPTMSDRDYLTLIENIPAVTYRCLPVVTWPMIFISDEIKQLVGWPAEDFIGLEPKRNYISTIHPEDQQMVSDIIFEAVSERHPYSIEYRVVTSEGKMRWVFERGQAIHEESGNPAYLDGTILDVTARKTAELELAKYRGHLEELVTKRTASLEEEVSAHQLAEEALAEKSRDLDDFFSRSSDILVIVGCDGTLHRISPSWTEILGYPLEDTLEKNARDFIHPNDLASATQEIRRIISEGGKGLITFRVRHLDGSYRHIEWHAYGQGNNLYSTGHDITNRLAMEQALRDSEEIFRTVFNFSPIGMALLRRPDSVCVDINDAMLQIVGHTKEQCLGSTPELIGFFVTQKDLEESNDICAKGISVRNEPMEYRRKDGSVLRIVLSCEPLKTSKGDFLLIFCSQSPVELGS